jgi:hypothetical protein
MSMTANQAAVLILEEEKGPLHSKEIAKRALDRGLVSSNSKDPVTSFAQTLEKNIRVGIYNNPKLVFIPTARGRLIGLPSMNGGASTKVESVGETQTINLRLPVEIIDRIQLASHAKIAKTFEETAVLLIKKGLAAVANDVRRGLTSRLNKFDEL